METRFLLQSLTRLSKTSSRSVNRNFMRFHPTPLQHSAYRRNFSLWPSSSPAVSNPVEKATTGPPTPLTPADESTLQSADTILNSIKDLPPELPYSLQDYGLGETWYVGSFQKLFQAMHDVTGLPWWLSISVTVFALRACLFPVVAHFMAHNARFANVQPEFAGMMTKIKAANQRRDALEMRNIQMEIQAFYKKYNVFPLKMLGLPFIQAPIFIGIFLALKRMANAGWPEFLNGGTLWFENLTLADPYYVLPVLSVGATLISIQIGADTGISASGQQKMTLNILRGVMVISIPFISQLPAGVLVYWVTQNITSILSAFLLKRPAMRRFFNIPEKKIHAPSATSALQTENKMKPMSFWEGMQAGAAIQEAAKNKTPALEMASSQVEASSPVQVPPKKHSPVRVNSKKKAKKIGQ